jgi:hypothetical protein
MPAASVSDFFPLLPSSPPSECVVCDPLEHRLAASALPTAMNDRSSPCPAFTSHSRDAVPSRVAQSCSSPRPRSHREAQHVPYPVDSTSDQPEGSTAVPDLAFVGVSPPGLVSCFPIVLSQADMGSLESRIRDILCLFATCRLHRMLPCHPRHTVRMTGGGLLPNGPWPKPWRFLKQELRALRIPA